MEFPLWPEMLQSLVSLCPGLTPEPGPGAPTLHVGDGGSGRAAGPALGHRVSLHGEAAVWMPALETCPCGVGLGPTTPSLLSPTPAVNQLYLLQLALQPACPAAAGPSPPTRAVTPNPHLQPSSSSSWPLPHVWFPWATRQTLGVALSSGGRLPLARPPPSSPPRPAALLWPQE